EMQARASVNLLEVELDEVGKSFGQHRPLAAPALDQPVETSRANHETADRTPGNSFLLAAGRELFSGLCHLIPLTDQGKLRGPRIPAFRSQFRSGRGTEPIHEVGQRP